MQQITALHKDEKRLKNVAYIIHPSLHLTYAQCVHGLKTNSPEAMQRAANRNIVKRNNEVAIRNATITDKTQHEKMLDEFDDNTFATLLIKQIAFAMTSKL